MNKLFRYLDMDSDDVKFWVDQFIAMILVTWGGTILLTLFILIATLPVYLLYKACQYFGV